MISYFTRCFLFLILIQLAIGFPECPSSGILRCSLNETVKSNVTLISNCVYIECPSLSLGNSTFTSIKNVSFIDSIGFSIFSNSRLTRVNISDSQFYNAPILINGKYNSISVIGTIFARSSGIEVYGSAHQIRVENSSFFDNSAPDYGGAISIYSDDGSVNLTIRNSHFDRNEAGQICGALFLPSLNHLLIVNSTFTENKAVLYGAIAVTANDVQIRGCLFIRNLAISEIAALYIEGGSSLLIEDTKFLGNIADIVGALAFAWDVQRTIVRGCEFRGNNATGGPGAIDVENVKYPILIDSCTFSNNSADTGNSGSIALYTVNDCTLINSSFDYDSATYSGGSVHVNNSVLTVSNCSFSNCATRGNGGFFYICCNSNVAISDSSFWNSSAGGGGVIFSLYSTVSLINCTQSGSKSRLLGGFASATRSILTVQGCSLNDNLSLFEGGCISVYLSELSISGSSFDQASAETGAQIFARNSGVSITNSVFNNSRAKQAAFLFFLESNSGAVLSITSCQVANSFASIFGAALFIDSTTTTSDYIFQDVSFYNVNSGFDSALANVIKASPLTFVNCEFVSISAISYALGQFQADVSFQSCLFRDIRSPLGNGNIRILAGQASFVDCQFVDVRGYKGGIGYVNSGGSLIGSDCTFTNVSAFDGGVVFGEPNSIISLENCLFNSINANSFGLIVFCNGVISMNNCTINGLDSGLLSPLFYVSGQGSVLAISGLTIGDGTIPDIDGSLFVCRVYCTVTVDTLIISNPQKILLNAITLDTFASLSISNSALIDLSASNLVKASSFSNVTLSNCTVAFSSAYMDQVFYLENGCTLTLDDSTSISNFRGKIAVLSADAGCSFQCFDSMVRGTSVPESAIKMYNGNMKLSNCKLEDNVSTGSVNECISTKSIVGAGGAVFAYSSSLLLIGGSVFRGNEADLGGAIFCVDCELTINDVSFESNVASLNGGAVWSDSSNLSISSLTLYSAQ